MESVGNLLRRQIANQIRNSAENKEDWIAGAIISRPTWLLILIGGL